MRIIIGITGASGFCLASGLIRELKEQGVEIHLVVSDAAKKVGKIEGCDIDATMAMADRTYSNDELEATISSSTYRLDGMVIVPCSLKTLSSVANGHSNNLISRAAENMIRMGRRLVIMPRETPFSPQALENMHKLSTYGVIVMPPVIAYYTMPKDMDDINAFFIGKVLDVFGMEHDLPRWKGV
ncbi:MAG TPA: UbiX family flavin prenyltransferase [Candidatus Methanofastidiosa archaeon]|nr:UbiX family flavin prenyltransferase [Candidatus Methanofastidiosa archaeon]